jgi:hypothetical protein
MKTVKFVNMSILAHIYGSEGAKHLLNKKISCENNN